MKAVMLSVQPRWCEKTASGDKTDEIRKNAPKLTGPFKCYLYQTSAVWGYPILRSLGLHDLLDRLEFGKSKVIGEFVCDKIEQIDVYNTKRISATSCVSLMDMWEYARPKSLYDLKAWHISSLVIYDKPKRLGDFKPWNRECKYSDLGFAIPKCQECHACKVERPPQSWCYVEELKGGDT